MRLHERNDRAERIAPATMIRATSCVAIAITIAGCAGTPDPSAQERAPATVARGDVAQGDSASMNTLTAQERAAGWRLLFDGRSLTGWRGYKQQSLPGGWEAVDGVLTRTGRGGDIITTDQFRDFELALEWRLSPDGPAGNSGIFFRATEESDEIYWGAPEMQILDNARHPDGRSPLTSAGSNYALHGVGHEHAKPVGEWNAMRLVVNGNHVEHWMNGTKVVEYELGSADWQRRVAESKFAPHPLYGKVERGHIGLQDHGTYVAFRNVRIRELP